MKFSGLALVCDTGEPGELMGRIDRGHPVRDYHGYADNNSSDKKIMKNVWRMGDMFFRCVIDKINKVFT